MNMKIVNSNGLNTPVKFKDLQDGVCFRVDPDQYPNDKDSLFMKVYKYGGLNAVNLSVNKFAILENNDYVTIVNAHIVLE